MQVGVAKLELPPQLITSRERCRMALSINPFTMGLAPSSRIMRIKSIGPSSMNNLPKISSAKLLETKGTFDRSIDLKP